MDEIEAYQVEVAEVIRGDIRMISGCQDDQCSEEIVTDDGALGGYCTQSFIFSHANVIVESWASLLASMYTTIRAHGKVQTPLLSASRMFDLNDSFSLFNPAASGRTRALIIAINYVGQDGELGGCHTDAEDLMNFIAGQGYSMDEADCRVLMDDGNHHCPDLQGIKDGICWLVSGATEGDSLFISFSGHGSRSQDSSGDEIDGWDETIVPVDHDTAGHLTDDDIFKQLVLPIPEGVTLTAVIDSCHSGSAFDLPFSCDITEASVADISELALHPNESFNLAALIEFNAEMEQAKEVVEEEGFEEAGDEEEVLDEEEEVEGEEEGGDEEEEVEEDGDEEDEVEEAGDEEEEVEEAGDEEEELEQEEGAEE